MQMIRRIGTTAILMAGLAVGACSSIEDITFFPIVDELFSFESGLEEWSSGVDVVPGGSGGVTVSSQESVTGSSAVRFDLDDPEGGGSVWIARGFEVLENTEYVVEIDAHLGSADGAGSVPWTVVVSAGGSPGSGITGGREAGSTGEGIGGEVVWSPVSTELTARSGPDGLLHVRIGVRSASADARSYWLDDVAVTLTQRE